MPENVPKPIPGSIYSADDGELLYVQYVDEPYVLVTNGVDTRIHRTDILANMRRIDNELERQRLDHTIPVAVNPNESWKETYQLLEMFFQRGVEITRRAMVPFTVVDFEGSLERLRNKEGGATYLRNAVGFWRWSTALLNVRHDEDGNEQFYIELRLFGEIFKRRLIDQVLARHPGVEEEEALGREQLNFEVRYRSAEEKEYTPISFGDGESEECQPMVIDFDMVLGMNDGDEKAA